MLAPMVFMAASTNDPILAIICSMASLTKLHLAGVGAVAVACDVGVELPGWS